VRLACLHHHHHHHRHHCHHHHDLRCVRYSYIDMGCAADVERALTFNHTMLGSRCFVISNLRHDMVACIPPPIPPPPVPPPPSPLPATYSVSHGQYRPVEIKRSAPPPRPSASTGGISKTVFVSNLPTDTSVVSIDVLRDAFGHCGAITNVVRSNSLKRVAVADATDAEPRDECFVHLLYLIHWSSGC
jgi:hypothetical protein